MTYINIIFNNQSVINDSKQILLFSNISDAQYTDAGVVVVKVVVIIHLLLHLVWRHLQPVVQLSATRLHTQDTVSG